MLISLPVFYIFSTDPLIYKFSTLIGYNTKPWQQACVASTQAR